MAAPSRAQASQALDLNWQILFLTDRMLDAIEASRRARGGQHAESRQLLARIAQNVTSLGALPPLPTEPVGADERAVIVARTLVLHRDLTGLISERVALGDVPDDSVPSRQNEFKLVTVSRQLGALHGQLDSIETYDDVEETPWELSARMEVAERAMDDLQDKRDRYARRVEQGGPEAEAARVRLAELDAAIAAYAEEMSDLSQQMRLNRLGLGTSFQ